MPLDSLYILDDYFRKASVEIFTILMGRTPNGKSDSMDWVTMKNYKTKCRERSELLEQQILTAAAEEKAKLFTLQKQQSYNANIRDKLTTHFKDKVTSLANLVQTPASSNIGLSTLASSE